MELTKLDAFTEGYVVAAIWSSIDDDSKSFDEFTLRDFDDKAKQQVLSDCKAFQEGNAELLKEWYELGFMEGGAGYDFWLTRNGHGAGFWDRYLEVRADANDESERSRARELGKRLTAAAKECGERTLYTYEEGGKKVVGMK